jgi:hypothetical protein
VLCGIRESPMLDLVLAEALEGRRDENAEAVRGLVHSLAFSLAS